MYSIKVYQLVCFGLISVYNVSLEDTPWFHLPHGNVSFIPGPLPSNLPHKAENTTITPSSIMITACLFIMVLLLPEAHADIGFIPVTRCWGAPQF